MKIIRLNYGLIILVLLSILFLSNESQFNPINNLDRKESPTTAQSQYSGGSLTVNQSFSLIETSENSGTQKNVSSVDINFDNSRWNVTNLKLNISDMYFKNETKTVVDTYDLPYTVEKNYPRLGVQFKISNPTILYGVYIYGQNYSLIPSKIYVQIHDSYQNGTPDERKRYGSPLVLNMTVSKGLTWHKQTFNSPISLSKGIYYLIINGTSIALTPPTQIKYSWWYKNLDLANPTLNTSRYERTLGWSPDYRFTGSILLHKLIQKINATLYPKQINMTAKINGIIQYFQDGNKPGSGNLSVSFNNFFPNALSLQFPIKNNVSEALIFNLSYYVKLNNSLICGGSVLIKDGLENGWIIEPILKRFGWNYSVSYTYPKSWEIIDVLKNDIKLTGNNYTINQNTLTILNNSIPSPTPYVPLIITANSTFFEVKLKSPLNTFIAGYDIGFIIDNPRPSNYTFILIDTIGIKRFENSTTYSPPGNLNFNWTLPMTSISGEWSAYFFWNNLTDAGAETYTFTVSGGTTENIIIPPPSDDGGNGKTEVTGLDPFVVFMTILIIGIVSASSFTSYATLKKVKKDRDIRRKKLFDKVTNILNLSHVIVIDKNSGLNIYQEFYGGKNVDTTLVSGFLDAIRSFGIELTSARTQSQTISLEYQDSKILMSEFKNFRLILIMGEKASEEFLKAITNLSYDIDSNFGEELKNFKGDVVKFREIRSFIEKHLNTAFVYPLNVFEPKDVKLNPSERAMILKAKKFMKENNLNYFFTSFLLSEQNLNPKDIEIIFKLLEKKIFQPIELTSNIK